MIDSSLFCFRSSLSLLELLLSYYSILTVICDPFNAKLLFIIQSLVGSLSTSSNGCTLRSPRPTGHTPPSHDDVNFWGYWRSNNKRAFQPKTFLQYIADLHNPSVPPARVPLISARDPLGAVRGRFTATGARAERLRNNDLPRRPQNPQFMAATKPQFQQQLANASGANQVW